MSSAQPRLEINIRRMSSTDLERIRALDHISFSLPWPDSSFKFEVEENEVSRCWVAETPLADGSMYIVAMIVAWLIVDEVHIATLAVDPAFRRQGIAQRLLAFTLIDAVRSGAACSFLEVRAGNLAARSLYSLFGYEEVGIRKKYYQDNGEDAVMMNLEKLDLVLLESLQ